jgi:hypothetical protein
VREGIIRVGGPTGAGYLPAAAVNGEAWPGAGAGMRDCGGVTCAHPKEGVQALPFMPSASTSWMPGTTMSSLLSAATA